MRGGIVLYAVASASDSAAYYYAHPESGEATWEEPMPPPFLPKFLNRIPRS